MPLLNLMLATHFITRTLTELLMTNWIFKPTGPGPSYPAGFSTWRFSNSGLIFAFLFARSKSIAMSLARQHPAGADKRTQDLEGGRRWVQARPCTWGNGRSARRCARRPGNR